MAPKSFEYGPFDWVGGPAPICPSCKKTIQRGDLVHWYREVLWHTQPCPD